MGMVVTKPNGEYEIITGTRDLIALIKEVLGSDVASAVQELADNAEAEKLKVESDFLSYEAQVESQASGFLTLEAEIDLLEDLLNADRLNRKNLQAVVKRMKTEIINYI